MRVFILGIDALSPVLLEKWMSDGHLPHFSRLCAQGTFAPLRSTGEFSSPQAWPSFMTGVNPGKHGIFSFLQRVPGTYEFKHVSSRDIAVPTIFQLLGQAGLRVAHLNIPVTFPVSDVNGLAVSGWLAPSLKAPGAVWPPELADELAENFGPYPFHADIKRFCLQGRYDLAVENALEGIRAKLRVGRHLYNREKWDLFTLVFVETDAVQHYFWHLADPSHPLHNPEEVRRWGNPVLKVYQEMDSVLGQIMDDLDSDSVLMVMSDHGGAIYNRGRVYVRSFLEQLGLLVRRPPNVRQRLLAPVRAAGSRAAEAMHGMLPKDFKMRLFNIPFTRGLIERFFADSFTVQNDWSQTRAYSYYWETSPWVNVRGREPEGIVEPGDEYEQVRELLIEKLSAAVDPVSGEQAVEQVFRREELYQGPQIEAMPDIGIWWNRRIPLDGLVLTDDGKQIEARPEINVAGITGGHDPDGVFIGSGGPFRSASGLHPKIEDLAPTVLYLLDQMVPGHMDGTPLLDALNAEFTAQRPVRTAAGSDRQDDDEGDIYDEDEEKLVEERLRNLGYI